MKPSMPAKANTSAMKAKPTQTPDVTPEAIEGPDPGLPSLSELVTIAAAMSTKGEKPGISASRAIELWKACHKTLKLETKLEKMSRGNSKDLITFLAACGLDFDAWSMTRKTKQLVPLETFLSAASPDSTRATIGKMWLKFLKKEKKDVIPESEVDRTESLYGPPGFSQFTLPSDPKAPIDSRSIEYCYKKFNEFLENNRIATGQKCGEAGVKARRRYDAVKQLYKNSEDLTEEQREMLVKLTKKEIETVIEKCLINGKTIRVENLNAAIKDLKTPAKGRPRVITNSDRGKKF